MSDKFYTTGLINVGGILTETKVRNTMATPEAKEAIGLNPEDNYRSSVGIASVKEKYIINSGEIKKGRRFNIPDLDTTVAPYLITDLYTANPAKDEFEMLVAFNDGRIGFQHSVVKNLLQMPLPKLYVAGGMMAGVAAETDIVNITFVIEFIDVFNNDDPSFYPAPTSSAS